MIPHISSSKARDKDIVLNVGTLSGRIADSSAIDPRQRVGTKNLPPRFCDGSVVKRYCQGLAEAVPFRDGCADLVFMSRELELIKHSRVPAPSRAIRRLIQFDIQTFTPA